MELTKDLNPDEFREYYFLKEELKDFCRKEGLKVSGSKGELEERIIHYLRTGDELIKPKTEQYHKPESSEISLDSRLGENFRCGEDKREFFEREIGQKWLKSNPDRTYRDAIDAYHEIQNSGEKTKIDKQFQYNRYIRDFFESNDGRSLDDAIKCWKYKKSLKGHNRYEESDLEILK